MSVRKIYVDSRRRIKGSTSNFTFQLSTPLDVPASRVWVDSVSLPNTFPSVHALNQFLYYKEYIGAATHEIKVPLSVGFYSGPELATEVAFVMNLSSQITDGTYACVFAD